MTFEVEPNPPGVGPSRLTITLTDKEGQPINQANLEIVGAMPQENIQLKMTKTQLKADGVYEAPFIWSTVGDWVLTVKATLPNNQIAERAFDVTVEEKMTIEMSANHSGHDNHTQPMRVPNEGSAVDFVTPKDGAVFEAGDDVKVEIITDNFTIGEAGNHWHIYVDDQPGVMIMGQMTDAVLRGLEPGRHEISTYLSVGSHKELEDGAMVTITVLGEDETASMMEADHMHRVIGK